MNAKTHKAGGICAGVSTVSILSSPPYTTNKILLAGTFIFGSYLGSLLPDIDHRKSTAGKKFKTASFVVNKTCGHRGATHAPLINLLLFTVLLSISIFFDNNIKSLYINFIYGMFVGSLSHILLDSLTIEGVPFFYPFNNKKYHLLKLKTGKNEVLIQTIIYLLTMVLIVCINN